MTNNKWPHVIELPEGTVYVTIRAADERQTSTDRGNVKWLRPEVNVTTDPDRDTYGYITLRGRKYRANQDYAPLTGEFSDAPQKSVRTGRMLYWTWIHTPYNGGYRNESGTQVDFDSPVYEKLDIIVAAALARFAEDNPLWMRESRRMFYQAKIRKANNEVANLREQLKKAIEVENEKYEELRRFDA
jgi:hypothetical protein